MSTGKLYVVATPIGNLQDFSPRAIEVLNSVDCILCEDTRHSSTLLANFAIKTKTIALHDHNEKNTAQQIVDKLLEGINYALISDAGTPLISDPGYYLTHLCHQHNIQVIPVPGCCAFITALSASGMPSDSFSFYGFLPAKSKQRREKLASIKNSQQTSIFYESPHRIEEFIQDVIAELGTQRQVCIARELTKQFETIKKATAQEILDYLQADTNHKKGEFVVLIEKGEIQQVELTLELQKLIEAIASQVQAKTLSKAVASAYGLNKNDIYDFILSLKNK